MSNSHQERSNEPPARESMGGANDEVTGGRESRVLGLNPEVADEGNVFTKLRRMVASPLSHIPSLALDNPLAVDGVLRRPYEHGLEERQGAPAEQNDTDSLSAYEDASAETPEQDRPFPGVADTQELQLVPESSVQSSEDKTQDPKPGEQCVVS